MIGPNYVLTFLLLYAVGVGMLSSTAITLLVSTATFLVSILAGSTIIFPSDPRGFLFHPVENNLPRLKRGNGWASVLMTT